MKVKVQGWSRNCGWKELVRSKLQRLKIPPHWQGDLYAGKPRLEYSFRNGRIEGVKFSSDARLRLSGNYLLEISLTREDIAHLHLIMSNHPQQG